MRIIAFLCLVVGLPGMALAQAEKQIPVSEQQVMLSYAPLVKKAAPAVVNIYTSRKVQVTSPLLNDPFFQQFLGGKLALQRQVNSLGSGVIVDAGGIVMTNNHVVKNSDEIKVVLADKREFSAKVVLADATTDLALLQLEQVKEALPTLPFADSDALEVGDMVLAIGNPFGVGQTVTGGIVSALARTTVGITDYQFFIQTDAAINPGNSGGALVDMQGRLVGINTAIYSRSGGSNGIGFAIPANMAATVLASQKQNGKVLRPWLGASLQPVTPEIADSLGLAAPTGAVVRKVQKGSPAEQAGLQPGDVILAVQEKAVPDVETLKFRIATLPVGGKAAVEILRKGAKLQVQLPLASPPEIPPRQLTPLKGLHPLSGAVVANLSPALVVETGAHLTEGVIIMAVDSRSTAARIGFKKGDIVLGINGTMLPNVDAVVRAVKAKPPRWVVTIDRGGKVLEVAVGR